MGWSGWVDHYRGVSKTFRGLTGFDRNALNLVLFSNSLSLLTVGNHLGVAPVNTPHKYAHGSSAWQKTAFAHILLALPVRLVHVPFARVLPAHVLMIRLSSRSCLVCSACPCCVFILYLLFLLLLLLLFLFLLFAFSSSSCVAATHSSLDYLDC